VVGRHRRRLDHRLGVDERLPVSLSEPRPDDDALDARSRSGCLLGDGPHVHGSAAPVEAVRRDEQLRLGVPESRGNRLGREA
jgi:hypothetical protein